MGGNLHAAPVLMIAADDWMVDADGNYLFNSNHLGDCHRNCEQEARKFMDDNSEFGILIVHNTFTMEKEMKPYKDAAEDYGYMVHQIIVENNHGNESTHGVPEKTMEKMERRFSVNLR